MAMKKLLLAGIAALFLTTGTAHATENYLVRCAGQFFTVYGHHGYSFNRSDAEGNEGPEMPKRLFRWSTNNETLFFRGRKCKYVPSDVFLKDLTPERNK
jgi:hypothetical protein